MSSNPTAPPAPQKQPICGFCKADPLVFAVVDGMMAGGQVVLRQMFCMECRAMIAVFPIAILPPKPEDAPLIQPPQGGRFRQ